MAILIINGAEMPSPSEMQIGYKDIGKAETAASGDTIMDRVAIKRTISASFAHLSKDQAQAILVALKTLLFFDLHFYDPLSGESMSGTFRCTSCTVSPWRYADGAPVGYTGGKITLEER